MSVQGSAEIFDQGYRSYDGPRAGVGSSMRAVAVATIQRALGLRRKFRFKIVPIVTVLIAYVPALVYLGLSVLLPSELAGELVPEYVAYFAIIGVTMILMTSFVVPEVMGADRKTGLFGLYMASPLTRWHYLAAKFVAIIGVLSLVTLLPVVFQMAGYSFVGIGPDGFVEIIKTLGKIVVSGFILSIFFGLLGMAAATMTDRHLFASAGIVLLTIASGIFTGVLVDTTDVPRWVELCNVVAIPLELITRVWGATDVIPEIEGVSTLASFLAWAGSCAVFAGIVGWGYHRMEVTK